MDSIQGRGSPSQPAVDVQLMPMKACFGISGNAVLHALYSAQQLHPLCDVWNPALKLPVKLVEYVSAICEDAPPQIRQGAVLLLKRYGWWFAKDKQNEVRRGLPHSQVVALTCAHLATKFWQQEGIPEHRLHGLSRNSYTRQEFINAETTVMLALGCNVHWVGALLAEWVPLLLSLAEPLLANVADAEILAGVSAHVADVLAFQDELMASYLPSELAAATIHTAVMLCTKRFQRHTLALRIGHLCRMQEEQVVHISEQILNASIGRRCAEVILEGSGVTAEDSDLEQEAIKSKRGQPANHDS